MEPTIFLAALGSAVLHAAWNAASRIRPDPGQGFAVIVYAAGFLALPGLIWSGLPALASWPWVLASMIANVFGLRALIAAYRRAPFALSYPICRGTAPLMVAVFGWLIFSEIPTALGIAGIMLISGGVLILAVEALRKVETDRKGVMLAIFSGLMAAVASFCDARGVRLSGNVFGYGLVMAIVNGAALWALAHFEGAKPWRALKGDWLFGCGVAVISTLSYLLILYAFQHGQIAPVAALRETSVFFATLMAVFLLRETVSPVRWAGAALATIGVVLIRIG